MDSQKTSQETTVKTAVRQNKGVRRGSDRRRGEVDSGVSN